MTAAKAATVLALLALADWNSAYSRFWSFSETARYAHSAVFLGLIIICIAGFVVIPYLRRAALRIPLLALALVGYAFERAYVAISGRPLDATMVDVLWRERAMASEATSSHAEAVLPIVAGVVAAGLVLGWRPYPPASLRARWALLPGLAFAGCVAVAAATLGGTVGIPAAFGVPAMFTVAAASSKYDGPREPIHVKPFGPSEYQTILMIVDESIRGDFLQINDPAHRTTPFLAGLGDSLINFGPAIAAHNCSAPARLILRTGMQPSELPDPESRALKVPVIWQYARAAGFRTVLVDAFAEVIDRHSYMRAAERSLIDEVIPVATPAVNERDQEIAQKVIPALMSRPEPHFIYVNKYGAHFPYRGSFPAHFNGATRSFPRDTLENAAELRVSYSYAVQYVVDEFFRALLPHVDLSRTLIVYTSDHGQSLLQGGYKMTHCSTGRVHIGEADVPILAMTRLGSFGGRLRDGADAAFGHTSHFNLFSTLLLAMGYDKGWVAGRYGASLLDPPSREPRRFLTGDMFSAWGSASWVTIDERPDEGPAALRTPM